MQADKLVIVCICVYVDVHTWTSMHTLKLLCLAVSNRQEKAPDYRVWHTAYLVLKPKSMREHFIAVTGHQVAKSEFTQPGTLSH